MPLIDRLKRRGSRVAQKLRGEESASPSAGGSPAEGLPTREATADPAPAPAPAPTPAPDRSPRSAEPTEGARNYVLLILDSCRFDAVVKARTPNLERLGELQRRYAYATWTAPSHYNLLMGLLPHPSPRHVFASEHYKDDFLRFRERLGIADLSWAGMVPRLWLPHNLRDQLGYQVSALVSMPVLNPMTPMAVGFDRYELAERHNDLSALIDQMRWSPDRPDFWLLNTGETHYPYATPEEPEERWPRIHGVNGVFKQVSQGQPLHQSQAPRFFDDDKLDLLRRRQVRAVEHVDRVLEQLYDTVPDNTWITITADHGELFGEEGYFGHGPILHDKVLEVPFVEGRLR